MMARMNESYSWLAPTAYCRLKHPTDYSRSNLSVCRSQRRKLVTKNISSNNYFIIIDNSVVGDSNGRGCRIFAYTPYHGTYLHTLPELPIHGPMWEPFCIIKRFY